MDTGAIKENNKMEKRYWTPVQKAGIQRCPLRSLEYDMNAAHLKGCKTMNTLIKAQNYCPDKKKCLKRSCVNGL